MVDHLKECTNSSAVYVGKVTLPIKKINDNADDTAHIIPDAVPHIEFIHASKGCESMVDKILLQEQGITYGLFTAGENPEEPPEQAAEDSAGEPEEDEDGNPIIKVKKPKETFPKHILVDEVVEEPRMHYYEVPKLGSYLAIKLEYDSCVTEESFDAAVFDYKEVNAKRRV